MESKVKLFSRTVKSDKLVSLQADISSFLSVLFQIVELSRQTTAYELRNNLKELPVELEDTYSLLLSRVTKQPSNKANLAKRVLKWLAHARQIVYWLKG